MMPEQYRPLCGDSNDGAFSVFLWMSLDADSRALVLAGRANELPLGEDGVNVFEHLKRAALAEIALTRPHLYDLETIN